MGVGSMRIFIVEETVATWQQMKTICDYFEIFSHVPFHESDDAPPVTTVIHSSAFKTLLNCIYCCISVTARDLFVRITIIASWDILSIATQQESIFHIIESLEVQLAAKQRFLLERTKSFYTTRVQDNPILTVNAFYYSQDHRKWAAHWSYRWIR